MATLIAGNYDFVNADAAYEQYLEATGLSAEYAQISKDLKHSVELSQNGDEWTMNIKAGTTTNVVTFKIGQEFSDTTPSGHIVKGIFRKVGDKLVETLTFENGFQPNIDMDFNDKGLRATYTWPGGKSVSNYKRL